MIEKIIKNEKTKILLCLYQSIGAKNMRQISKQVDGTYNHIVNMINEMQGHGLLEKNKKGREVLVTLTEKGAEIGMLLNKIDKNMEE